MKVKLEFSGGMDLLFGNKKMHVLDLADSGEPTGTTSGKVGLNFVHYHIRTAAGDTVKQRSDKTVLSPSIPPAVDGWAHNHVGT
jgi:hypothetical protein